MKVKIQKSELSKALHLLQSIVEKKTTMPILSNFLLTAVDNGLRLAATDLEITAVSLVPAKVDGRGSTTINARIFSEIVRELPDGELSLHLSDNERLEIKTGRSSLKMVGVSAEEYPTLQGVDLQAKGRVAAPQLVEMINRTIYAVSQDETRFNLSGVCFEPLVEKAGKKTNSSLRLVATDGHRLAMITRPLEDIAVTQKVIVPRKGLTEVRKLLEEVGDSVVGIDLKEGFLKIETPNSQLSVRLIDAEFPDYTQVIPQEKGVRATIDSELLAQALRRVALMVTDKAKCVKLDFAKGVLRISSSSPELGEAKEELEIDYSGEPLSIGFNARYMLDIINAFGEKRQVCLDLFGTSGPGRFSSAGDESALAIVMPMRLT